jgi:hypothetical protein
MTPKIRQIKYLSLHRKEKLAFRAQRESFSPVLRGAGLNRGPLPRSLSAFAACICLVGVSAAQETGQSTPVACTQTGGSELERITVTGYLISRIGEGPSGATSGYRWRRSFSLDFASHAKFTASRSAQRGDQRSRNSIIGKCNLHLPIMAGLTPKSRSGKGRAAVSALGAHFSTKNAG